MIYDGTTLQCLVVPTDDKSILYRVVLQPVHVHHIRYTKQYAVMTQLQLYKEYELHRDCSHKHIKMKLICTLQSMHI